jgi:hypothetical protein
VALFHGLGRSQVEENVRALILVEFFYARDGGDDRVPRFLPFGKTGVKDFDVFVTELFRLPGG